jgi:lantibiotic biosynthesis protein
MNHSSYLELADRIGARICRDANWDGGRCNWVAGYLARDTRDGVDYQALDPSLYRGTSGIALFLGRLARVTGERIFLETAEGALRQALSQTMAQGATRTDRLQASGQCGLYTGFAGVAYALAQGGEPFFSTGVSLAKTALALPPTQEHDVIAGSAGVVATALHFYRACGEPGFLDAAVSHGQSLLDGAQRSEAGWSWLTLAAAAPSGRPNLTGFGHGVAGIAWALLELWHATGEQRFRAAAEEGFRYEQSWFNVEHGNWPDLRAWSSANPAPPSRDIWCHGAAGIALSRLRAAQITGDVQYSEQAEVALAVVDRGLSSQGSCCLCHGLFGSIDLLLYANTPERRALAESAARDAINRYVSQRLPWPCGVRGGHETPDLMLGLAGIGHTLLRLNDPAAFPSPLIVADRR